MFYFDICLFEHLFGKWVLKRIPVDYSFYPSLDNHFGTQKTWETGCVQSGSLTVFSTCFHDCRLFSVQTHTLVEVDPLAHIVVAPFASSLIAVDESEWSAIVARRNNSVVHGNNGSIPLLHTVRPTSS